MAEAQLSMRAVLPDIPPGISRPIPTPSLPIDTSNAIPRNRAAFDSFTSPVNQNGSFEFDRVVKGGVVQKRTQKTKGWKSAYLVLRPNAISLYKNEKENKLRHKVNLSDLTAVATLKDPKNKRKHVFGCFSPARNYHFQANSEDDALEWVDLIRSYARIDEEEEELLLASPVGQRPSFMASAAAIANAGKSAAHRSGDMITSSSPEPSDPAPSHYITSDRRRPSNMMESSGYSGNELASHSDFSDSEIQRIRGLSIEDLAVNAPAGGHVNATERPGLAHRNSSQVSGINNEQDPDRIAWQGWLWFLRSKGGVRQWKRQWAVLRPRNFILYKDDSEYSALFIRPMSAIVDVVDIDPVSRTKVNCLQIITEEKSYRFCAPDEESLVRCLGAFKSLLAKRRELESRAAAASGAQS